MLKPGDRTADAGIRHGKSYGDASKATALPTAARTKGAVSMN
jgi:hypothetical protein